MKRVDTLTKETGVYITMKMITVHGLINHLSKYPGDLKVGFYSPPSPTGYRVIAPSLEENQWLYNKSSLYIPILRTRSRDLPKTYKPLNKKLRRRDM